MPPQPLEKERRARSNAFVEVVSALTHISQFLFSPFPCDEVPSEPLTSSNDFDQLEREFGMMIQCEECLSWQHGPCVGLSKEEDCPQQYYCEQCRPELHSSSSRHGLVERESSA